MTTYVDAEEFDVYLNRDERTVQVQLTYIPDGEDEPICVAATLDYEALLVFMGVAAEMMRDG